MRCMALAFSDWISKRTVSHTEWYQFKEIICHNSYARQKSLALTEYSMPPVIIAPLIICTSRPCWECVGKMLVLPGLNCPGNCAKTPRFGVSVCGYVTLNNSPVNLHSLHLIALFMEQTNTCLFIWKKKRQQTFCGTCDAKMKY